MSNYDLLRAGMFTAAADRQFGLVGGGLVNCTLNNPELLVVAAKIVPVVVEEQEKQ